MEPLIAAKTVLVATGTGADRPPAARPANGVVLTQEKATPTGIKTLRSKKEEWLGR